MNIEFFVAGTPKPAGSKVTGVAHKRDPTTGQQVPVRGADGRLKTFTKDDTGEAGVNWRADVRAAAQTAMRGAYITTEPVMVTATFLMRRTKGHFGAAGNVKATAPVWHTVRPDVDKLSRAVLDALKAIVWEDDSQVVCKIVTKRYANPEEREGARITVSTYIPADAATTRPQLELIS